MAEFCSYSRYLFQIVLIPNDTQAKRCSTTGRYFLEGQLHLRRHTYTHSAQDAGVEQSLPCEKPSEDRNEEDTPPAAR